jgi:hypothetical protein
MTRVWFEAHFGTAYDTDGTATTNQVLVDREGTFGLMFASHSDCLSTPTTAISSPFCMSMVRSELRMKRVECIEG